MECGYLYGWIKKNVTIRKNLTKVVNPRDMAGNTEEEEKVLHKLLSLFITKSTYTR